MAEQRGKRSFLPSKLQKNRTLVIVALIIGVVIVAIVVALALGSYNSPGGGGTGPAPQQYVRSGTGTALKVDSVAVDQNPANSTATIFVTMTNTGNETVEGNLSVEINQGSQPSSPQQPYPGRGPAPRNPSPVLSTASTRQPVSLGPGETEVVSVDISAPPGSAISPSDVVITLA